MPGTCRNCLYLIKKDKNEVAAEFCMFKRDWQVGLARCRSFIEYVPKVEIYTVARATISARRAIPGPHVDPKKRVIEVRRFSDDIYLSIILATVFAALFLGMIFWLI